LAQFKFSKIAPRQQSKILTKGYSPIEQHELHTKLGPWTDIYAVGASMRSCLELKTPVSAQDRSRQDTLIPAVKAFKQKFPEHLLKAIDWAMDIQRKTVRNRLPELQQVLTGG